MEAIWVPKEYNTLAHELAKSSFLDTVYVSLNVTNLPCRIHTIVNIEASC